MKNDELVVLLQKNIYTMKMDNLFSVGLMSIRDMFRAMEPPERRERDTRCDLQTLAITAMYVSHLLKQIDPTLIQIAESQPASQHPEIIVEDNMYSPANSKIQNRGPAPLRYIIVDDTKVVADLFTIVVEIVNGTVVGTASTGSEALIQYVDLLPDIVVMDISMPDMNGIEAIKRIVAMNPMANIIVISGNNYEEIRREVFDLGVKLFIGKPFHVEHVANVLSKLIGEVQFNA